jgi:hypothetical protein
MPDLPMRARFPLTGTPHGYNYFGVFGQARVLRQFLVLLSAYSPRRITRRFQHRKAWLTV